MPRRDGTGPMGRGMFFCNAAKDEGAIVGLGLGLGIGCRRGFGWNGFSNTINSENQKDLLIKQKVILENRLNLVNNQLNTLQDE